MKRRSSTKQQPEETIYFIDRNLGSRFVAALREAGLSVIAHDEESKQSTQDSEWIPIVSKRGWIVITNDKPISRDEMEIELFIRSGCRAFRMCGGMAQSEFAGLIHRTRRKIEQYIRKQEKLGITAYYATIHPHPKLPHSRAGSVKRWIDERRWQEIVERRKKRS